MRDYDAINHEITVEICDKIISRYQDELLIQKIGIYYGALLYFNMARDSLYTDHASISITIEALYWTLEDNNGEICNSDSITREFAETSLIEMMKGIKFQDFSIDSANDRTVLSFSENFRITLKHRIPSLDDCYDRLLVFYLPEEQSVSLTLTPEGLPRLELEIGGQTRNN